MVTHNFNEAKERQLEMSKNGYLERASRVQELFMNALTEDEEHMASAVASDAVGKKSTDVTDVTLGSKLISIQLKRDWSPEVCRVWYTATQLLEEMGTIQNNETITAYLYIYVEERIGQDVCRRYIWIWATKIY